MDRVRRWGQTNLCERDPERYDASFWRAHWRRTRVQGVIVNGGGIVAYYPSELELHYRARALGERDLFGEIVAAARGEGLAVLARMDSNRAGEAFYRAHPDWFCVDRAGEPVRAQGRYISCVNGPYYRDYIPRVLEEIIRRYRPEGFTDNSWSGLGRGTICHCTHCARTFRESTGLELPREADWKDPVYRRWITWSYETRLEVWDLNNRVTREHGGPDCLWLGMLNGNTIGQSRAFRNLPALGKRSRIIMCDHQSREFGYGFEQNGLNGKLLHGVMGWDRQVPESMAMYVRGARPFRLSANPPAEARSWMAAGFAGGISPWWHHITAQHEDRRQYETAEPLMRWHEENEQYLYDRDPIGAVGVLWSHENIDFHGRDDPEERVGLPWRGVVQSLTSARIPYLPVHADRLDDLPESLEALFLPDLAVVSDSQAAAVRRFVERGGGVIATGATGLRDAWGDPRSDCLLADLFGVRAAGAVTEPESLSEQSWEVYRTHTYLRISPEWSGSDPAPRSDARHPVLRGFEGTNILPFGGTMRRVTADPGTEVPATYVPAFPIYPPEFCWTVRPQTDIPALVAREHPSGGRTLFSAADIDRCAARYQLPDHTRLIANLVCWAARDRIPLRIDGPGALDCHLYRQGDRRILHVVNLTHCRGWPALADSPVPVGPFEVAVACGDSRPSRARLQVAGTEARIVNEGAEARFTIPSVAVHEMVILE